MTDLQTNLEKLWQFAEELCNEVHTFQPDVVLILMHSGWIPFFAGRELWNRVETAPFPPVVCTNLGREKISVFDQAVKNPFGVTSYFIGNFDSDNSIAFFLGWLAGKMDWQAELRVQFQEQLGELVPERILIVDEFIHEGSTVILTLGLLSQLYPHAQTRFLNANVEWQECFWETWVRNEQPGLLQTEIFGPPPEDGQVQHPLWLLGRQVAKGSADFATDSLRWQKINAETGFLQDLVRFLPVENWLSLPVWVERIVRDEIARRTGEYTPDPVPPGKWYPELSLKQCLLRELFIHGRLSVQQISATLDLPIRQARRELLRLMDAGLMLVEKEGPVSRFVTSPMTQAGYWQRSRPLLDCYWVAPDQLLVGDFPGWDLESDHETLLKRLDWLLEQGITFFLDLSEQYPGRPNSYQRLLDLKAAEKGYNVTYLGKHLPRRNLPARARLVEILNLVDQALASGQVVYLHRLHVGGIEDALAGCWLVRHGLTGQQALEKLQEARRGMLDAWRRAPYTARARKLVQSWQE